MLTSKPQPPQDTSNDSAWHLDKKVNISHIIATLIHTSPALSIAGL